MFPYRILSTWKSIVNFSKNDVLHFSHKLLYFLNCVNDLTTNFQKETETLRYVFTLEVRNITKLGSTKMGMVGSIQFLKFQWILFGS